MTTCTASGKSLVLLGAGGHAKVLLSLMLTTGAPILGVCDPELARQRIDRWRGLTVIGGDEALSQYAPDSIALVNGVGQLPGSKARHRLFEHCRSKGFHFASMLHPQSWVDPSAQIHEGAQIMAGAIVQADAVIGQNSIINTGATIDHDCQIGAHVHIAPGATLCGSVRVGDQAFVGSGATIIQGVTVNDGNVVGAGTVLIRNLGCD